MAHSPIAEAVKKLLDANPHATNEEVAFAIRKMFPQAATTAASVSSIKSRLKQTTGFVVDPIVASELPTFASPSDMPNITDEESLEDAKKRISVRYKALERMAKRIVAGKMPSLIISGPPGLGKSYTVLNALEAQFPDGPEIEAAVDEDGEGNYGELHYDVVSGSITAVGLYQALWYTRNGGILVLDDCDAVFRDEDCLNILKAVLDSKVNRTVSWRKEAKWLADYGIDDRFTFKGHVVFLTNIDFEAAIIAGTKMSEHFKALVDRSMYLCLTLRTRRDFMIRIREVSEGPEGMLATQFGLDADQAEEVLSFVADNQERFYNLSLRLVGQIALCMNMDAEGWREDVEATKMKTM